MYILIGILICIIFVLSVILWKYQRQVRDICRQLAFLKEHDSNMMITKDMEFGSIGRLAELLNDILSARRQEKKEYLEKERIIADTYTSLSHDIRTPLTSLDGYFQMMQNSDSSEEQQRYLAIIKERISSLKEMLEELFTFTKLKNDSYQLELSKCQINRILKETVFSYYEEWQEKQIEPEFCITEEALYMQGNPQALRRVIQNIIKNGLEHGQKRIRISLEHKEAMIQIQISNEVENPQDLDVTKVFERFYKADSVRSTNSTGLGLSIAKEFVEKMNGSIKAELRENEFSISICFPCMQVK